MNTAVEREPIRCAVGTMPPLVPLPIKTIGYRFKFLRALRARRHWVMREDWAIDVPSADGTTTHKVIIPAGFTHDGASVPPFAGAALVLIVLYLTDLWWVILPALYIVQKIETYIISAIGLALIPSIVHDHLFQHRYLPGADGTRLFDQCSLGEADAIFRRLHIIVNGMPKTARLTFFVLRLGSWVPWNRLRFEERRSARA